MFSRSATSAPMITATRTTTDSCRTGRSMRRANASERLRTARPITTGTITRAKTCSTLPNCSPIPSGPMSGSKHHRAKLVMIGSVTMAGTALTAVSVTFSATSPPKRWLKRFAVVPPPFRGRRGGKETHGPPGRPR